MKEVTVTKKKGGRKITATFDITAICQYGLGVLGWVFTQKKEEAKPTVQMWVIGVLIAIVLVAGGLVTGMYIKGREVAAPKDVTNSAVISEKSEIGKVTNWEDSTITWESVAASLAKKKIGE